MEAVFGLVGVVVGGLLTGAVTWRLEKRRESREAQIGRKVVELELRAATRAVADALEGRKWPPGWHTVSWVQSWSTYRSFLAVNMEDEEFAILGRAYLYMGLLQTGLAAGEREFDERGRDEAFLNEARSYLSDSVLLFDAQP